MVAQRASVGARQPSTGTDKRTQLLSVHATGLESTESVMCRLVPLDNHDRNIVQKGIVNRWRAELRARQ